MNEVGRWGAVAVAGGVGALARVEVTAWAGRRWPGAPVGTRLVNLLGTLAVALLLLVEVDPVVLRVLGLGFLGGFTTFSTWMLDADLQPPATREIIVQLVPALALVLVVLR